MCIVLSSQSRGQCEMRSPTLYIPSAANSFSDAGPVPERDETGASISFRNRDAS